MANNRALIWGRDVELAITSPVAPNAVDGGPCLVGRMPCVALTTPNASTNVATVEFEGVYNLSVTGADENGNAAITVGSVVFYDPDTNTLDIDATEGIRFGYALDPVSSGATTVIRVKLGTGNGS